MNLQKNKMSKKSMSKKKNNKVTWLLQLLINKIKQTKLWNNNLMTATLRSNFFLKSKNNILYDYILNSRGQKQKNYRKY